MELNTGKEQAAGHICACKGLNERSWSTSGQLQNQSVLNVKNTAGSHIVKAIFRRLEWLLLELPQLGTFLLKEQTIREQRIICSIRVKSLCAKTLAEERF